MSVLDVVWQRDLHQQPNPRSYLVGDLIIVPERESHLVRIHPETGEAMWDARVLNTWGWLAVSPTHCFWLNQHDTLQALHLETGEPAWEHTLSGDTSGISGFIEVHENRLLVGGWRGYTDMLALDVETGEEAWRVPCRNKAISQPVSMRDGIAIPSLSGDGLGVFDSNGRLRGRLEFPGKVSAPDATPLLGVHDNALFIATTDGTYWKLSPKRDRWIPVFHHQDGISTFRPEIVGDNVVFLDASERLQVYDVAGQHRWAVSWAHNRNDLLPVQVAANKLIVGSSFGRVTVFDTDGAVVARKQPGRRINSSIAVTTAGTVVLATTGALLGLNGPE